MRETRCQTDARHHQRPDMPDLLIELFSEEIPARMQARGADDLRKLMTDGLVEAGLTYAGAAAFAGPRRLVLTVEGLPGKSPTVREERKGPRVDAPEKALEGFLRSTGLSKDQLEARDDKKGQVWFASIERPGRPAAEIVAEVLEATVRSFPWPKSMRWGSGSLRWVRPLHSILAILVDETGARVVPLDVDGIVAGDTTQGHRFMAPGRITVTGFDDYETKLKRAHVILRADERAETIRNAAEQLAFAQGFEVVEDRGLLAEVAGLAEWPVVLMGEIGAEFLDLPAEVLQTSMREHQKFFSLRNPQTGRIERYITVANRETSDHGAAILAGNGKVLAARLADAKFFWENDLRVARAGMDPWLDKLGNVTFHNKLGSQAERIARIATLAREIAPMVGADADQAEQAAKLAKADLASEMVYEFPELQGIMGRYYALEAGHTAEVADAARDHYQPLGPNDDVPTAPVSVAVALADKLDLLTGFWAIDEKPTGSKDPFALRRAALGVIRIVLENRLRVDLRPLIKREILRNELAKNGDAASDGAVVVLKSILDEIAHHGIFGAALRAARERFSGTPALSEFEQDSLAMRLRADVPATAKDLIGFIMDRLKVFLRWREFSHDVIEACLREDAPVDLAILVARVEALQNFLGTDDGENLVQGFKRANNILRAEEKKDGIEYSLDPDVKFAESDSERALFAALDAADAAIEPALAGEDFAVAMEALAGLRGPIDRFFEETQVNSENSIVRRNRLCLLNRIRTSMGRVARFEVLEG